MKLCLACGLKRPIDCFYRKLDGLQAKCKICQKAYIKQWEAAHPERVRKRENERYLRRREQVLQSHRFRKTGWTPEAFSAAWEAQGGCCAICETELATGYADHCHKTGRTRAILCNRCNRSIGLFEDSPELLMKAAQYLLSFPES